VNVGDGEWCELCVDVWSGMEISTLSGWTGAEDAEGEDVVLESDISAMQRNREVLGCVYLCPKS
jgi:hypothetical protein